MRDLAALANVSLKTVSRVINQDPGVSDAVIDRVQEAVRLLDYRPNMAASSLRRADRKTWMIGLLLEDAANPFSAVLHRAIEDAAAARDTLVLTGSSDEDLQRERELLAAFASRQSDGLIVVPAGQDHTNLIAERRRGGLPIVFVDRPATFADADSVTADNRGGASLAVRHLADHGHRRVAFLGDLRTVWTAAEREAGYLEGLAAAGIGYDRALVRRDVHGVEAGELAALDLLGAPDPPTALFTSQNLITIGAVRALRRRNLQRAVALVGFDDILLADLLEPGLSVIRQDPAALGRAAADLLFARLAGDERPSQHVVLPVELVARGSGEIGN